MDTYSTLRHFADSWALAALAALFAGIVLFAWRPGSRSAQAEAGSLPFRHEDRPAPRLGGPACDRGCGACSCGEGAQ